MQQLTRWMDNPDEPMVPERFAKKLAQTRDNVCLSPAKVMADGGHKVNVIQYVLARCQLATPNKTAEEVYGNATRYFDFCEQNLVPPTLGIWALWNGYTLQALAQVEKDTRHPERGKAYGAVKESIRSFMEQAAWEGSVNLIQYLHSQKALFDIVEKQQVTVVVEDNTTEIDESERAERVEMLLGSDGVYRQG